MREFLLEFSVKIETVVIVHFVIRGFKMSFTSNRSKLRARYVSLAFNSITFDEILSQQNQVRRLDARLNWRSDETNTFSNSTTILNSVVR